MFTFCLMVLTTCIIETNFSNVPSVRFTRFLLLWSLHVVQLGASSSWNSKLWGFPAVLHWSFDLKAWFIRSSLIWHVTKWFCKTKMSVNNWLTRSKPNIVQSNEKPKYLTRGTGATVGNLCKTEWSSKESMLEWSWENENMGEGNGIQWPKWNC